MNIKNAFKEFFQECEISQINAIKSGHINDTYQISILSKENEKAFILQRINHHIFKDIAGLMNNIKAVTEHLQAVLVASNEEEIKKKVLHFYPARDGNYYFRDNDSNYWRCCDFIPGMLTFDIVGDKEIAYEGGKIFGRFQKQLSSFNPAMLVETIPRFHDLEWRWENLQKAVKADTVSRVHFVKEEIAFATKRFRELVKLTIDFKKGLIPVRITHNDTKFNNILFSDSGKAMCIIDLDTIMPGTVLHDFGDAIRSSCNTAAEDETDLSKICYNLMVFEAYTSGYLSEANSFLSDAEYEYLGISCRFMTFIMGVRFLTDYLEGDTYYKIHRPGHNLDRCRAQFRLIECMESVTEDMRQIINSNR